MTCLSHTYSFTILQADSVFFFKLLAFEQMSTVFVTEILDLSQSHQDLNWGQNHVFYLGRIWKSLTLPAALSTVNDRVPILPQKIET